MGRKTWWVGVSTLVVGEEEEEEEEEEDEGCLLKGVC